jgi:Arc/MetJ-type ribon-helix-helix transcriptional regulator
MSPRKRGPGRPPKAARDRATVTLTVRLYREDAALLDALTAARGESASDVLRAALRALHAAHADD